MKNENASFIKRLLAFILDMFIVTIISSFVTFPFSSNNNYEKLVKESSDVMEQYVNGKIDPKTYISKSSDINYDISKETGMITIITIAVYILYFVILQFYNKGRTLGKKLLKIRTASSIDNKELTMNQIALRSLIIDSILLNLILIIVTIFGNKDFYFVSSTLLQLLNMIILFSIAIMVLSREDRKGLHDLIAKTKVINEE